MSQSLQLRLLAAADLAYADSLRALVGWNQTLEDWRRFLALEPTGCFLAEWEGQPAGTATTTVHESGLAWIGMVLVHPEYRRRGIGRALLNRCIAHLQDRGIQCTKLDATPQGKSVYEALGFKSEWSLTRWEHPAFCAKFPQPDSRLRSWRATDPELVEACDQAAFGVSRRKLLNALAALNGNTLILETAPGVATGFGMLRAGARALYLGPVAAASSPEGLAIVNALLARAPGARIFWDIPDANTDAVDWARRHGFNPQRPLSRMVLGINIAPGNPSQQFALSGPETG